MRFLFDQQPQARAKAVRLERLGWNPMQRALIELHLNTIIQSLPKLLNREVLL